MAEFPASLLILNGKSTDNLPLREAIMLLREEGMTIHVRVTWEKGDAARFVEEARKLGVATVIAGGGDGTINEVSTALIQCEGDDIPALGILPLGTANDFATSVGIPEALDKALKLAIAGDAIAIDMAQVNKQTCFINMATGGFGTRITTETPEKLKAVWILCNRTVVKSAVKTFTGKVTPWSLVLVTGVRPVAVSNCVRTR